MGILLFNSGWMAWNLMLAWFSVYLGWLMWKARNKSTKYLWAFLWLIFAPNTIYILTDLYHLTYQQYALSGFGKFILFTQYALFIPFGFITFIYSIHFFEKAFAKLKVNQALLLFAVNLLIGIGVMVGRFQRTNSWEIFIDPINTVGDILATVKSSTLLLWGLGFGIFCHAVYFLYRKAFIKS